MANRNTKLVLSDLIAKKIQKEQSKPKPKEVYIHSLGGTLTVNPPDEENILEAIDEIGQDQRVSNIVKAYDRLIYQSVQLFKNTELHREYEVIEPTEIVAKLLTLNERMEIGAQIMEMNDFNKVDTKVKN